MKIGNYVKNIGEISLRVDEMELMVDFYVNKLGFNLRRRFNDDVAAIQVGQTVYGQVETITLFSKKLPPNESSHIWSGLNNRESPLHHFALTIKNDDYTSLMASLSELGVKFETANHRWTGWKGVYIRDPELNIIEFVCYDEEIDEGKQGTYDFNKLHGAEDRAPFE
ncbi:VOC family protein [Vibrio cholerae]